MRKRKGLIIEKLSLFLIIGAILFLSGSVLLAQTRVMPVGNSITWGKVNNQPPPGNSEGYRKILHEKLTDNGISTIFVGDSGSVDNRGHFADNARIGWFIHPDSLMGDMTTALKIQRDLLKYVSLRIVPGRVEEYNGQQFARDLEFQELSFVRAPGDTSVKIIDKD